LSAHAGKSRTEVGNYHTLEITPSEHGVSGRFSNGVTFMPRPGERAVSIVLMDDYTASVSASVGQDLDGDGIDDHEIRICDRTTKPFKIDPTVEVTVAVQEGTCNGQPSFATSGQVKATFTR
jgi:hypothetical protein